MTADWLTFPLLLFTLGTLPMSLATSWHIAWYNYSMFALLCATFYCFNPVTGMIFFGSGTKNLIARSSSGFFKLSFSNIS